MIEENNYPEKGIIKTKLSSFSEYNYLQDIEKNQKTLFDEIQHLKKDIQQIKSKIIR